MFLVYAHEPNLSAPKNQEGHEPQTAEVHQGKVRHLANLLREEWGIEVMCDSYVHCEPPMEWPQWMDEQITQADFVGIVWTKSIVDHVNRRRTRRSKTGQGFRFEMQGVLEAVRARRKDSTSLPDVFIIQFEGDDFWDIPSVLSYDPVFVLNSPWPSTDDESLQCLASYMRGEGDPPPSAAERRGETNYSSLPERNEVQKEVKKFFSPEGLGRIALIVSI